MTVVKERSRQRKRVTSSIAALLFLVGACWAVVLAATPAPGGNPVLRTTSPGSTEMVKSPDRVVLTFDRPVPAGLATVRILDPDGSQVVYERPVHPDGDEDAISVPLPKERHEGTYAVAWTLPSGQLEPLKGSFTFDVYSTIEPDGVPDIETTHDLTVTIVYVTSKVVALLAMATLAGAVFFVALAGPRRFARWLVKVSGWTLAGATVVTLLSFGPYAAWAPLSGSFDPRLLSGAVESGTGGALLARLYVLVPVALGIAQLLSLERPDDARERWWRAITVLGCAAAVCYTWIFAEPRPAELLSVALIAALTVAVLALGAVMLVRWKVVRVAAAAGLLAVVIFVALGQGIGTPAPPAVREQVAPTRLAFDVGGGGSADLVLLPQSEGQQVRIDTRLSFVDTNDHARDDVTVTAQLTGAGRTVPLALQHAGTGYLAGEATLPAHGTWQLQLVLRAGSGTQTLTQPIDVR